MNAEDLKARRAQLIAELQALPPASAVTSVEARRIRSRREEIAADLGNLKRKLSAWNRAAAAESQRAAAARRAKLTGDELAKAESQRAAKAAARAKRAAEVCEGCRLGYPIRPCEIDGTPQHRGPDFTFRCRAIMPVHLTRGETIDKLARKLQRMISKIPSDKLEGHTIDLASALADFLPAQREHLARRRAAGLAPGATAASWESR
jgi:hypothetical protein